MSKKDTKFKKKTINAFKECIDDISKNIVRIDGRRPYDKTVLREADESVQGVIATAPPIYCTSYWILFYP
jgi:thymidylate kinase